MVIKTTDAAQAADAQRRGIWAVMAAFNEAKVIADVVDELKRSIPNVVVVDDASSDATSEVLLPLKIDLLRHPINLGQGAALQTGIAHALKQGAQIIVTFDADGQHRPEDALRLAQAVAQGECEVALGSRFLGSAQGMPGLRRALLKAAVVFQHLTSGVRLTDAHNGLRAFNRNAALALDIRENRMAHASEMIEQFSHSGLAIREYPVTIRYTAYSLAKGQRMSNAVNIAMKVLLGKLTR